MAKSENVKLKNIESGKKLKSNKKNKKKAFKYFVITKIFQQKIMKKIKIKFFFSTNFKCFKTKILFIIFRKKFTKLFKDESAYYLFVAL